MSDSPSTTRGRRRVRRAVPLSVAMLLAAGFTAAPALAATAPATKATHTAPTGLTINASRCSMTNGASGAGRATRQN